MSAIELKQRLMIIAKDGISSANRNNPFYNKSEAFKNYNRIRKIIG